jgi:hypothetical protein
MAGICILLRFGINHNLSPFLLPVGKEVYSSNPNPFLSLNMILQGTVWLKARKIFTKKYFEVY